MPGPAVGVTVDMPNKKVVYGAEGPKPSVEMFMKADVAHRNEERHVAREHHRDDRDDAGVHRPEHRPTP